jgi:ATP-dependent exoDNAse (exonuclease V) alpha subunit
MYLIELQIHLRLQEIATEENTSGLFGNMSILLVGDILQLPPVKTPQVFHSLTGQEIRRYFGTAAPSLNLWRQFTYSELEQNMRQGEDLDFSLLLNRMRVQQLTEDDHAQLRSRLIAPNGDATLLEIVDRFVALRDVDPTAVAVFGTNDEVDMFNAEVCKQQQLTAVIVPAIDTESCRHSKKTTSGMERPWQLAKNDLAGARQPKGRKARGFDASMAGGLPQLLALAKGARVILRRNLNKKIGLVNGAMGTLLEFWNDADGKPLQLEIKFDRIDAVQLITKATATFHVSTDEQVSRQQFPVTLAFGVTVHKCQVSAFVSFLSTLF